MLTHSKAYGHSVIHVYTHLSLPQQLILAFIWFCFDYVNVITCLIMRWRVHSMWVLHNIMFSADDALHLFGSNMLSADFMHDDTAQMPDWQLMPALFACTAAFALSIRTGRISQASSAVFHMCSYHIAVYIVVRFIGRRGC